MSFSSDNCVTAVLGQLTGRDNLRRWRSFEGLRRRLPEECIASGFTLED